MDGSSRRATIYTFLNDVPLGGSTAFPFAHLPMTRDNVANVSMTRECDEHFNCCSDQCVAVNASACNQELTDRQNSSDPMTVKQMRHCLQTLGRETWTLGEAGLEVSPKRGSAIIWFNYNTETHGFREELHESHHCGCDVEQGVKWGSNLWVRDADPVNLALNYVRRVARARKVGRRRSISALLELGDESFDIWTISELSGPVALSESSWLHGLALELRLEMLGVGPGGKPAYMYRRSPNLALVRSMEEHIRAAVFLHESLNITRFPAERLLMSGFDKQDD